MKGPLMDQSAIADRRQLRRKLTFWRIAAVLLLLAIGFSLYSAVSGTGSARPHVARIEIDGVITDNDEPIERLEAIRKNAQVKGLVVSISSPGGNDVRWGTNLQGHSCGCCRKARCVRCSHSCGICRLHDCGSR